MRKETFLDLLSDIDDDLIEEAEKVQKGKQRNIMKYLATAACICVVLGGSLIGSFVEYSEEKMVKTSSIKTTQKIANVKDENITSDNKFNEKENSSTQSEKLKENQDTKEARQEKKKQSDQSKMSSKNNWYNGEGTGEFVFNKKVYRIVNSTEYLLSNSLPIQIGVADVGSNLANNVYDTANNNIGNVYEYKNESNKDVDNKGLLIVEDMNGIYNLAVEE